MFKQTKVVFKEKNFLYLFLAEIITVFGDVLFFTAITWFIFSQSNSTLSISLLNIADLVPTLLFIFFFGILIDRSNSRLVFRIIYITQAIVVLVLIGSFFAGKINLYVILLCVFVNAMVASGKSPLVNKILVAIGRDSLSDMNTLLSVGKKICIIAGSLLAGLLAENIFLIIFIDFITFLVAFTFISRITVDYDSKETEQKKKVRLRDEFRDTFLYLKNNRNISLFIFVFVFIIIAGISTSISMPVISKEILNMGNEGFGMLKAALSAGGIVVIFLMPVIKKSENKLHWLIFFSGLAIVLYAFGTNIYINMLVLAIIGIFSVMTDILFTTVLQKNIDEKIIGKIFSVIIAVAILSSMAGNLIYGVLFDRFDIQPVLIASGGLFMLLSWFLGKIIKKD